MANQQGNITAGTTETGYQGNTVPGDEKLQKKSSSGDELTRRLGEHQQQRRPKLENDDEAVEKDFAISEEDEDMNIRRGNRH